VEEAEEAEEAEEKIRLKQYVSLRSKGRHKSLIDFPELKPLRFLILSSLIYDVIFFW
jgi:hypothetical protein